MCGRYALFDDEDTMMEYLDIAHPFYHVGPRYNIHPQPDILAVRQGANGNEAVMLYWDLIPHWAKAEKTGYKMSNARAETVDSKPSFRMPFKRQRCLIPANGFYEWNQSAKPKIPYAIAMKDRSLFAMAGLWDKWESKSGKVIESCTIIVTIPNTVTEAVHDRMPVILKPEDFERWLDPDFQDIAELKQLLKPYPASQMTNWQVSKKVNNPRNEGPELFEPL